MTATLHQADAYEVVPTLDDESVSLLVTSPAYWGGQRDYGLGDDQLGWESSPDLYVKRLVEMANLARPKLTRDGLMVWNVGDKRCNGYLAGVPYLLVAAMLAEGWGLVNDIQWIKQNPTPRGNVRSLATAHEPFYVFAKTRHYKYRTDDFEIKQPKPVRAGAGIGEGYLKIIRESEVLTDDQKDAARAAVAVLRQEIEDGKIKSFRMKIRGAHKDPFGGRPGGRQTAIERDGFAPIRLWGKRAQQYDHFTEPQRQVKGLKHTAPFPLRAVKRIIRLCTDEGDVVLDPFMGSGTTGEAAINLRRRFVGIELSGEHFAEAQARIDRAQPDSQLRSVMEGV